MLLKTFVENIQYHALEETDKEKDSVSNEDNKNEKAKMSSAKHATGRNAAVGFTDNSNAVFAFLQAVTLEVPRVMASLFLIRADRRPHDWFHQWTDLHLTQHPTHHKNAPQDHAGPTGVLS